MVDVAAIRAGDRRALARLLTRIENGAPEAAAALARLFPATGQAHLIGITGPPGSGKSSLVNELAKTFRRADQTVAIIAVDPSSPFTGGAILGDRIRMRDLSGDPGVFIRSMASRGSLGGLARATGEVVTAFDAAGFNKVLIETVGAGQAEVDIARAAHTTLVIEAPGLGDDVQAIKAGILEIADVLVVNKADQPNAENTLRALRASLDLAHPTARLWVDHSGHHAPSHPPPETPTDTTLWIPPILPTVAVQGQGLAELAEAIDKHRWYLQTTGELERRVRERLTHELDSRLRETLLQRLMAQVGNGPWAALVNRLMARELDPTTAAHELVSAQMPRSA
jgi:LAO/AO transport system kinase